MTKVFGHLKVIEKIFGHEAGIYLTKCRYTHPS